MAGVNIVAIPYKAAGPALNDMLGGQVQLMFASAASVMPHIKSGRLVALGVSSAQPSALFPGLPTVAAAGVQPTVEALQAAASNADWAKAPGYYVILTDQPGEKSWPITASTFILMHKEPTDKAASGEAIKFFKWAFAKGDKMAEELDYIPMPDNVVKLIEKTWSADIKS